MRALILLCFLMTSVCHARAIRFDLKDAALRNLVHFVSDAPLEKVMGLSSSLSGWLELNPEKLGEGVKGELEVDLRTFHTGAESRNEYVRESFLNTTEHPIATYQITRLVNASKTKLADGKPVSVKLEGI